MTWTDDMLRLNTRIIAAEARLAMHVTNLLARGGQGHDASEIERLLTTDQKTLRLLRHLRDTMLDEIKGEE